MATWLDQQIEQLERIVERRLDLCNVPCSADRCILPHHEMTEPHQFLIEFLEVQVQQGVRVFADRVPTETSIEFTDCWA